MQAFTPDPLAYLWLKRAYKEVFQSDGDYKDQTAIVGCAAARCRGAAGRARHHAGAADAAMFTAQNPDKAAASFQPYAQGREPAIQAMVAITPPPPRR